jgi:hypothetical protein
MTDGVFGVNEGIIDSHNIDLAMLHTVMVVSQKNSGNGEVVDGENRTRCERPEIHVSRSDSNSAPAEGILTHETTDAAEAVDADFGNHDRGLWS